jgi:hypothetical protein
MFVFLGFLKVVLLQVDQPLKISQHTQFHGHTLTGENFASAILERLKLWDYQLWRRDHLEWHDLHAEFHKIYRMVQS